MDTTSGTSETNNKKIVNERFECTYTQNKIFYLIGWITTFEVYADFHNNSASNFLISPALHTRSKLACWSILISSSLFSHLVIFTPLCRLPPIMEGWLGQAVNTHRQLPARHSTIQSYAPASFLQAPED